MPASCMSVAIQSESHWRRHTAHSDTATEQSPLIHRLGPRRGCAAKSLLRHSNVQTTAQFYIKSVPTETLRAVEKMDALFHKDAVTAPN